MGKAGSAGGSLDIFRRCRKSVFRSGPSCLLPLVCIVVGIIGNVSEPTDATIYSCRSCRRAGCRSVMAGRGRVQYGIELQPLSSSRAARIGWRRGCSQTRRLAGTKPFRIRQIPFRVHQRLSKESPENTFTGADSCGEAAKRIRAGPSAMEA